MRNHARSSGLTKLTSLAALALVACQDGNAPTAPSTESPGISAAIVPGEGVAVEVLATDVQPQFQQGPTALAFDSNGNLYVATGGNVANADALKILKIPAGTNVPQEFGDVAILDPDGVAIDSHDNILVSGIPVTKFAPTGTVIWQVSCPIGNIQPVTVDDDDNAYVGSLGTEICKISADGSSVEFFSSFGEPSELVVSPDGFLYVAQGNPSNIIKVSLTDGTFLEVVATGLFVQPTFGPSGVLVAGRTDVGSVAEISPNGSFTTVASGFTFPRGLAFDPNGTLFIADVIDKVIYKVLWPEQQVHAIMHGVDDLSADGALNQGNANALTAILDNVLKSVQKDKRNTTNLLGAFINNVEAYIAEGILTNEQGEPLIDAAQDVIDQLGT